MGITEDHIEHALKLQELLQKELATFSTSLEKDEQRQHSEKAEKDAKIRNLECQVQILKIKLDSAEAESSSRPSPSGALEGSYDGVSKYQFEVLSREYERAMTARAILESRCRRYKEMLREWRDYCKIWVEKKGPRPTVQKTTLSGETAARRQRVDVEHPTPPMPPSNITPTPPLEEQQTRLLADDPAAPRDGARQRLSANREGSGKLIEMLRESLSEKAAKIAVDDSSRPTTSDSSRGSGDIGESHPNFHFSRSDGQDDDSVVIVSEKTIKRKRPSVKAEPKISIHLDDHIKIEPGSASPILGTSCCPAPRVQDSLDLDDIGRSFDTPRKRQRLERIRRLTRVAEDPKSQPAMARQNDIQGPEGDIAINGIKNEQLDTTQTQNQRRNSRDHCSEKIGTKEPNHLAKDQATMGKHDDHDQVLEPQVPPTSGNKLQARVIKPISKSRHTYDRLEGVPNHPAVLGPKDPNSIPRTGNRKLPSVAQTFSDKGAAYILDLAEDGDAYKPSKYGVRTPHTLDSAQKKSNMDAANRSAPPNILNRLGSLLDRPASAKTSFLHSAPNLRSSKRSTSPETPISLSRGSSVHRPHHEFFSSRARRHTPDHQKQLSAKAKATIQKVPDVQVDPTESPPPINPEDEPLRARPLSNLRLSDFKLNKTYSEYAFQESIRKHDEKRKVGGCTDPFCARCKEISHFAALTNFVPPQTTTLFGSSPPDPATADDALLLDYLGGGDDAKACLDRMTADGRKETLQKAKEKSFADLYGRHRQLHNRAVSPPGYWETEFPSTQQEMENREAARVIDRARVGERWEEAMRGGMWKFADE